MDTSTLEKYQSLLTLCEHLKRAKQRLTVLTNQLKNSSNSNEEEVRNMYIEVGKAHMEVERVTELVISHT